MTDDFVNATTDDYGANKIARSPFARALYFNPIAIAEGAVGAPRIQTAGIQDGAVTTDKIDVNAALEATARDAMAGAVGTYAFLGHNKTGSDISGQTALFGETLAGSNLAPAGLSIRAGAGGTSNSFSATFVVAHDSLETVEHAGQNLSISGTWRCMGVARVRGSGGTFRGGASLWLRIS